MVLRRLRIGLVAAAAVTAVVVVCSVRQAAAQGPGIPPVTQAYNFYVPPDPYYGIGAQLYVSPRPTPPRVGHTYITYEPLAPHEFLYEHHRVYRRVHPDGTATRVSVGWHTGLFPWCNFHDKGKYHDVPRLPIIGK